MAYYIRSHYWKLARKIIHFNIHYKKAKNNYFILIYPNQDQHHIFMKENVGIKFIK